MLPSSEYPSEPVSSPRAAVAQFPGERRTDASLVAGAAAGERAAIACIWDRYGSMVRGIVYSSLGADHHVEDLVQEVFIAFMRGASRMKEGAALRGYLASIAVRQVAQEIRRRKVRRLVGLTPSGELPEQPSLPADSEHREVLSALHRVLGRLSERRRMAFILRQVHSLEILEVAAALKISESTLRRELAAARDFMERAKVAEPALAAYLAQEASK